MTIRTRLFASTLLFATAAATTAQAQDEGGDIQFAPDEGDAPVGNPAPAPANPAPAPANPAPSAEPAPAAAAPAAETTAEQPRLKPGRPERIFGRYRVRFALSKPTFDEGRTKDTYQELYGNPKLYPTLGADWFAFDWYATIGLTLRGGYYTADGHASKAVPGKTPDDVEVEEIEKDDNGPTTLTLVPLDVALAAEFTPFAKKWIVLDVWAGKEWLYYQEVRNGGSDTKPKAGLVDTSTTSSDDALTNKGTKHLTIFGAAANILLNPLDEESAQSMRGSMGLGSVYLSPYMEIAKARADDGVDFSRKTYGVFFTFETIY